MPKTLLTDLAERKLTAAAGSGTQVAITHIALGDGNGANYEPGHDQTQLQREKAREPILKRHIVNNGNAWRVKAEFGPETPAFQVREIGFFDADGDLIAIWAGNDVEPRKTGVVTFLIDHLLVFGSDYNDDVVVVQAPDDEVFDLAVAIGTSLASIQLEQLRQADEIRELQRTS